MKTPINPGLFKTLPFKHQLDGIRALVDRPYFALFDEMGAGKSKQVVDAACTLALNGIINTVVVVAPASVRCVWLDSEIGEIRKHSWVAAAVWEFHKKLKSKWEEPNSKMNWIVTNYEFLRDPEHVAKLGDLIKGSKALLVLDESAYIKNRVAAQTKGVMALRGKCERCVILNGTPVTNSPLDLWSQMAVLSPIILQSLYKNFYLFRYEYCEMVTQKFGIRSFQKVARYRRLDQLAKRLAPHVLRREKKDCLDLPPKLYTEREVKLGPEAWLMYKELKRDCVITLNAAGDKQLEPNAAVRILRLAQLTSGILGVVQQPPPRNTMEAIEAQIDGTEMAEGDPLCRDISDEKLRWAVQYIAEECTAKAIIVWTRWRRERERLFEMLTKFSSRNTSQLRAALNRLTVSQLYGGQNEKDREQAVRFFSGFESPTLTLEDQSEKRAVLIAQPHAGGHGLNLVAASEAIYLSNDFALGIRLQSEDRCHRPGQKNTVTYIDVLATGPKGEKTIDHVIFKALRDKNNVADLTCAEWRKELDTF